MRILLIIIGSFLVLKCGSKESSRIGQQMAPPFEGETADDKSTTSAANTSSENSPTNTSANSTTNFPVNEPESSTEKSDKISLPESPPDTSLPATDEDMAYKKLLQDCGGIDPAQPDKLVVDQILDAIPARQSGREIVFGIPVNYNVDIAGSLKVQSSISGHNNQTSLVVLAAKPKLAEGIAKKRVAAQNGLIDHNYVTYSDRASLADRHPSWSGITCTVQPGRRATNDVDGHVIAEFDPPMPVSISPIPIGTRFEAEIGSKIVWTGITAKVIESTNPVLKVGETIVGTVTVEAIPVVGSAVKPDGTSVSFSGDRAYQITTLFGTPAKTVALGIKPVTKYYIDHGHKQFNAIVADLQDGVSPVMSFVMRRPVP